MSKYFLVDLPNPHKIDGGWVCVTAFPTKEEAIEFAQVQFGADDDGKIDLVREVDDNGETYEEE